MFLFLFFGVLFSVCFLFCSAAFCVFSMPWDCSLDYVQVHNRSLLWPSDIDGHALSCTNSLSGKYKLVKRPGGSHEGVGRKKGKSSLVCLRGASDPPVWGAVLSHLHLLLGSASFKPHSTSGHRETTRKGHVKADSERPFVM